MTVPSFPSNTASISLLVVLSAFNTAYAAPNASLNPERWEFSWSDEFDYTGKPNSEIWDYDYGYLGFNEELQNYTDQPENVRVENGCLVIAACLDEVSGARSKEVITELKGSNADVSILGNREFTSARLVTRGKKEFSHARVEARARFTKGRGSWPAIWLLGDQTKNLWPICGEIDIMEHVGYDPNHVHSAVHTKDSNFMNHINVKDSVILPDVWAEFHTYAVEWSASEIRFFIDDICYHVVPKGKRTDDDWPFTEDDLYYLILNIAVGGSWGGIEGIDMTSYPQQMIVDYVRVFERK
ncbi:glycoside hydrolase family 16 protein [Opitutales bacterium]|nr:glycoside hydrolase family 16 protein [Opitutales bacterium]